MKITAFSELTIDGRMTVTPGGSSKALFGYYGDEMRAWFHGQRASHDAIMVGAGTVRADDPELTVRHAPGLSPVRVIPTNDGAIPDGSHVLTDGHPTWFAVPDDLPEPVRERLRRHEGIDLIDAGHEKVDLIRLVAALEQRGVQSLMVEGGSRLLHALFAHGLIDRIVIKHIPVLTGAVDASSYISRGSGAIHVPHSRWHVVQWRLIGGVGVAIYERGDAS